MAVSINWPEIVIVGVACIASEKLAVTVITSPFTKVEELVGDALCDKETVGASESTSLSIFGADTIWSNKLVNAASEVGSIEKVIVDTIVPSTRRSSTLETVIICGIFQFTLVKVKLLKEVVISSVGEIIRSTTTLDSGCLFKTTVKLAVWESPSVSVPKSGDTVKPGTSLSILVTVTVCDARSVKATLEVAFILAVIDTVWEPSTITSSTELRVMFWGSFQLVLSKVKLDVLTVTSVVSKLAISMITSVSGSTRRTKETVAVCGFPSCKVPETVLNVYPGTSLSKLGTEIFCVAKVLNGPAVVSVLTEIDIVLFTFPSTIRSSTELKVTVCGIFQSVLVNVIEDVSALTVTSLKSKLAMSRITWSPGLGRAFRVRVKLTVDKDPSKRLPPPSELNVNPATSSSAIWIA